MSFTNFPGATTFFSDSATAETGTFINQGGRARLNGGTTVFQADSNAGGGPFVQGANITNEGFDGVNGRGGVTLFNERSSAGRSIINNNGGKTAGGYVLFNDASSAAAAVLIATGGSGGPVSGGAIFFHQSFSNIGPPDGGTCQVEVFGNGNLDISGVFFAPGITAGSIEGDGNIFLGAENLAVGSNGLNEKFSGVIQDGGINGGTGGSFTKIGPGKVTFTSGNTYTGGTTLSAGALLATNTTGSATGSAPVQVNSGTLGSTGKISGAVTVGNGSTAGATVLPGTAKKPGTLTINNTLTFNSPATYKCVLNRTTLAAGKVSALGVTIKSGATFNLVDTTTGTLTTGTVFSVINNTSANPISGTFSNLADGSTFISGGTTFKANYEGGDGNDLILTVR